MFFNNPEKCRQKLLKKVEKSAFQDYLKVALPDVNSYLSDIEFLALDFETTGLDAKKEAILSMGCTVIKNGKVIIKQNDHHLIKVNRNIPAESVVIHKITDDRSQQGMHLHHALEYLLSKMAGRVLLVHYDKIERAFLNAACEKIYGHKPPMLMVDTLALAKKRLDRLPQPYDPKRLRLFNLRNEYNLPRYNAHSALEDAIATAELFLAQMAHGKGFEKVFLKEIIG